VTLRAGGGLGHLDSVVGTPRAPFGLGYFLFGYSHNLSSTPLSPPTEIESSLSRLVALIDLFFVFSFDESVKRPNSSSVLFFVFCV